MLYMLRPFVVMPNKATRTQAPQGTPIQQNAPMIARGSHFQGVSFNYVRDPERDLPKKSLLTMWRWCPQP